MHTTKQNKGFSVSCYQGDAKTLLAFNLPKSASKRLAGFTIQYEFGQNYSYFVHNELQFKDPSQHTQVSTYPATSSINAPIHKFRWVHVPGSLNQGITPFYGDYIYTITPRYFDSNGSLIVLDSDLSVSIPFKVGPFSKGNVELGFTRGFVQSEAFTHHFGEKALIRPKGKELIFDTEQVSGKNKLGKSYSFEEEYAWLGFTARSKIFEILNEVLKDKKLHLDVFAYDLNEPDIINIFLTLAKENRIRIILDDAALHHTASDTKPEDQFEKLFIEATKDPKTILRGNYGRYAHHKVFIVSKANKAIKVLSGSTNLSITGVYVNSNHVVVFKDPDIAGTYLKVFEESFAGKATMAFNKTPEAGQTFSFNAKNTPKTTITFSPHQKPFAATVVGDLAARITGESNQKAKGSVLFAVMGLDEGSGPILPALKKLHSNQTIFSYGVSDTPGGIYLYAPRTKAGVLVSGKPGKTLLPPPFNQRASIGIGHQIHHKFVVCGFNGSEPVVYFGSSNLAQLGEEQNGDNLIAVYDADIATVFAIEALALVDHFDFMNRIASKDKESEVSGSKKKMAQDAGWFLSTSDKWTEKYFDENDLRFVDRELFA